MIYLGRALETSREEAVIHIEEAWRGRDILPGFTTLTYGLLPHQLMTMFCFPPLELLISRSQGSLITCLRKIFTNIEFIGSFSIWYSEYLNRVPHHFIFTPSFNSNCFEMYPHNHLNLTFIPNVNPCFVAFHHSSRLLKNDNLINPNDRQQFSLLKLSMMIFFVEDTTQRSQNINLVF